MRSEKEIRARLKIMVEMRDEAFRDLVWHAERGAVPATSRGADHLRAVDLSIVELSWALDDDKALHSKPLRKATR